MEQVSSFLSKIFFIEGKKEGGVVGGWGGGSFIVFFGVSLVYGIIIIFNNIH